MRLKFSILWFDDSQDYFHSVDLDWLKDKIHEWGFSPNIQLATTPEEFTKFRPYKRFDLIVVDRDLEKYGEGQNFIAEVRDNAVYTEVIFYTVGNTSDLWSAIIEQKLEGVFVSSRELILEKIVKIGRQSIRKVLDLENMRGIVMAEVGELDHLLDEIIAFSMAGLPDDKKQKVFKGFHEGFQKQNIKTGELLAGFIQNPRLETMQELSDSSKRWQNLKRLWKHHEGLSSRAGIDDFDAEVLKPRNSLAHGKPEYLDDGSCIFKYQGKEYRFDDEVSLQLRQKILKYKKNFLEIRDALKT